MDSKIILVIFLFLTSLFSCANLKDKKIDRKPMNNHGNEFSKSEEALRKVIVYKTKVNYITKVPIQLDDSKLNIISYPGPTDFSSNFLGKNAIELSDGYLLDQVGVTLNTVFTSFEINSYKSMEVPLIETFKKNIIDLEPFIEFYSCFYLISEKQANKFIQNNQLADSCKRMK